MIEKGLSSRKDFLKAGGIGIAGAALLGAAGGASLLEAATGARQLPTFQFLASGAKHWADGQGGGAGGLSRELEPWEIPQDANESLPLAATFARGVGQ
jgi:DMSO/TMAO reductase YedYZ molybdopterin-dependent catalytic subunit